MVLSNVPLLNWNQQMGILLVFPLGEHLVVQLLGGGQVGLFDVDLGGNKTTNHTKHADTYIFKKNLTCIEKRFLAVKHWNLVEALLHDQFSNSEKLFIGQIDHHIKN